MKRVLFILILGLTNCSLYASHIIGGEVTYDYLGVGSQPNTSRFTVYLRLFRDCDVACGNNSMIACLPQEALVSIFVNQPPFLRIQNITVPFYHSEQARLTSFPECISSRPSVCYEVKIYTADVELPNNDEGYILSYQNCCRAESFNVVDNALSGNGVPGVTYDCIMPGNNILTKGNNSSAVFTLRDPALVCYSSNFTIDYSATDADGDSLSYSFEPADASGQSFTASQDNTPSDSPVFPELTYNTPSGYTGLMPLGEQVSIDPVTGVISGIAPAIPGRYVVNVVVKEWRNGIMIGKHRKDFILRVENCTIPKAVLKPSYITCDGFNLTFQNESVSDNINSYYWDFGDTASHANNISTDPIAAHNYLDSGTYIVKLVTNRGHDCADSTTTSAKVYPGFKPDFIIQGSCVQNPFTFKDATTSKYGKVDGWRWDFGDDLTDADTSVIKDPFYKYATIGDKNVQLIVSNSKGCTDTVYHTTTVKDKPDISVPFTDTLICSIDSLQLSASSDLIAPTYNWLPNNNIRNLNTDHPTVYPKATTDYIVTVDDGKGCVNSDTVLVRVIDKVDLELGDDIQLCQGDTVQLRPVTNGLYFQWSPAVYINDVKALEPLAYPPVTTLYTLRASVGKCYADDEVKIKVAPYPQVTASANDTAICYGATTQLHAEVVGSSFTWTPVSSLQNSAMLSPIARPLQTTTYTIIVIDTIGCPKPVSANVQVIVIPPVRAFAGNDTVIVANQPLQLNATGGNMYSWTPVTGMDNPNIASPIVILNSTYDSLVYTVKVSTPEGCYAYDSVEVRLFKTNPEIFIPSAFTPNADGRNDILKPILAGMKKLEYFRVYNRWGQLLFSTSDIGKGWDGTVNGNLQPTGAYVYVAQAVNYLGQTVLRKGTVVLIR